MCINFIFNLKCEPIFLNFNVEILLTLERVEMQDLLKVKEYPSFVDGKKYIFRFIPLSKK